MAATFAHPRRTGDLAGSDPRGPRTSVCEPIVRVSLEVPIDKIGAAMPAVARLGAAVETPSLQGDLAITESVLPATGAARALQRQLPG